LIKAHKTDVGYDLSILEDITISPLEVVDVPTGVFIDLPDDVWGRLVHRSSSFRKHRILVLEGVIDPGFRGELKVCLYNLFNKDVTLYKGMKLAQLILMPRLDATFNKVDSIDKLSESERGTNCFGSSGL
jgi:dUTP pyrophosphatase